MRQRLPREVGLRPGDLHDGELEGEARVGSLTDVVHGDCEEVDEPQDGGLGQLVRLLAQELLRVVGDGERLGHVPHVLDEEQMAQVLEQVRDEPAQVLPALRELVEEEERSGRVLVDDHVAEPEQRLLVDRADELEHGLRVDGVVRRGGELVERRDRVAEGTSGGARDQRQRRVLGLYALALSDPAQ